MNNMMKNVVLVGKKENGEGEGKGSDNKFLEPFPKQQTLDSSKLKKFADDNFKFNKNSRKLS